VNHATAASAAGRLYVIGGYGAERRAFVFAAGRWSELRRLPAPRAAAGGAIVGRRLYVVGGVTAPGSLATRTLAFDLRRRRWSFAPAPIPREHLAVVAHRGRVYALAGRENGTNFTYLQSYAPGARRWTTLPPIPSSRGGTGVAAVGRRLVSIGGEEAAGTIASVYAYDIGARHWSRLPDLPTPRHGLGVVAFGGRVYAIAGGPRPGLFVSAANEFLSLG
jgi:N-acetylneuraminic acid mutarotase